MTCDESSEQWAGSTGRSGAHPHNHSNVLQQFTPEWGGGHPVGIDEAEDGSGDSTTWAVLIEAMDYAQIGTQHIEAMKKELLTGEVCQ